MKYFKKHRILIISFLVLAIVCFVILPWAQIGYGYQDRGLMDSYATRAAWILLATAWIGFLVFDIFKEGVKTLGRVALVSAIVFVPFILILRPVFQIGAYLINTGVTIEKKTRAFQVLSLSHKGTELDLFPADGKAPAVRLEYSDDLPHSIGDTIIVVERSGLLGVSRFMAR